MRLFLLLMMSGDRVELLVNEKVELVSLRHKVSAYEEEEE